MKVIYNLISLIIVFAVIYLEFVNSKIYFDLTLLPTVNAQVFRLSFVQVMSIIFFLGLSAGAFWAAAIQLHLRRKIKVYKKKLEKNSLRITESSSKTKVLESKIATLEKALESALAKNND